jgi:hypothetical protein
LRAAAGATAGRALEIFHCSGGCSLTIGDVMTAIGEVCGVAISFGPPRSATDKAVDRAIDPNRVFADTEWVFERAQLDGALPPAPAGARRPPVTVADLQRIVRWYVSAAERAGAGPHAARPAPAVLPGAQDAPALAPI